MTPRSADDPPERDHPTKDVQEGYNDPVPVGQFAQFVHDVTPWRSPMTSRPSLPSSSPRTPLLLDGPGRREAIRFSGMGVSSSLTSYCGAMIVSTSCRNVRVHHAVRTKNRPINDWSGMEFWR